MDAQSNPEVPRHGIGCAALPGNISEVEVFYHERRFISHERPCLELELSVAAFVHLYLHSSSDHPNQSAILIANQKKKYIPIIKPIVFIETSIHLIGSLIA